MARVADATRTAAVPAGRNGTAHRSNGVANAHGSVANGAASATGGAFLEDNGAADSVSHDGPHCCALYHRAVELIGKRWTGAILLVMTDGSLRFSEIRHRVPDLSDRLLSERLKELEAEGIVERHVFDEIPVRVEYQLTPKGHTLEPVLRDLKTWAHRWIEHSTNGSAASAAPHN